MGFKLFGKKPVNVPAHKSDNGFEPTEGEKLLISTYGADQTPFTKVKEIIAMFVTDEERRGLVWDEIRTARVTREDIESISPRGLER